jgi:hypothetical protein
VIPHRAQVKFGKRNSIDYLSGSKFMKDVMELLRTKEQELSKVKRQVEALRVAAPLLGDDDPLGAVATPKNKKDSGN